MSRRQIVAVVVTLVVLALLLGWQFVLDRHVADCQASGGSWDGPTMRCLPNPAPPIIERGLRRTEAWRAPACACAL